MKCDNCNKEITENVYWLTGYVLNACSIDCLAKYFLHINVSKVKDRERDK